MWKLKLMNFLIVFSIISLYNGKIRTESSKFIPDCISDYSVCGYIQKNSIGLLAKVMICTCKGDVYCPLIWDEYDRRSYSHGTEQYKFCEDLPELDECLPNDIALSTYLEYSLATGQTLVNYHRILCLCPNEYIYVKNYSISHALDKSIYVNSANYFCRVTPECKANDYCMTRVLASSFLFETKLCDCPPNMFCPNNFDLAAEVEEYSEGTAYSMKCKY